MDESTNETFVVQWNKVNDFFTVTYMVTWTNGSYTNSYATTATSLTVTDPGLTANTTYYVTITAINTCCGAGPTSDAVRAKTNLDVPTDSPAMTVTVTISPTPTAACTVSLNESSGTIAWLSTLTSIRKIL